MQTITGKLTEHLPIQEGDSQRGHWVRGGFVIEYGEEYPRKAAFSLFGEDKVLEYADIKPGTIVQVNYFPDSRLFNDRWFTDLRCVSVNTVSNNPNFQ